MKKFLIVLFLSFGCLCANASELKQLPFKNIKDNAKITVSENSGWTNKVNKKDFCYIKNGSSFYIKDSNTGFDTNCSYVFIYKGRLLGYSPSDLKFYEFLFNEGSIKKQEIDSFEISNIFKDFHVILISEFSDYTNVFKFKKRRSEEKIMIINDTDMFFDNYGFTTNNSKFEKYSINNAICITKRGLIQFSKYGENTKNSPWYILLVR